MKQRNLFLSIITCLLVAVVASYAFAVPFRQDDRTRRAQRQQGVQRNGANQRQGEAHRQGGAQKSLPSKDSILAQPIIENEDTIPDSLLHPRWKIQRTMPITLNDLNQGAADLRRPDNLKQEVVYNDTINRYIIGSKIGDSYINAPVMMTPEEYRKWSERKAMQSYFRSKNDEIYKAKGKEKFDFTDMHFDLGPAEKIFGPGGVRIKTQGTAELKFGATMKNIDNPSLPIRNRKTTNIDFDEKINLNVN